MRPEGGSTMRVLFAALLVMATPVAWAQSQSDQHVFEYDRKAPLDIQESGVTKRGGVAVRDISYASPKGGRVPAYLVTPPGNGPFAAVIWGHWYWNNSPARNRTEF